MEAVLEEAEEVLWYERKKVQSWIISNILNLCDKKKNLKKDNYSDPGDVVLLETNNHFLDWAQDLQQTPRTTLKKEKLIMLWSLDNKSQQNCQNYLTRHALMRQRDRWQNLVKEWTHLDNQLYLSRDKTTLETLEARVHLYCSQLAVSWNTFRLKYKTVVGSLHPVIMIMRPT